MVCYKKKLELIELCASVHCRVAEPTRKIPVSLPLAKNGESQSLQNLNSNVDPLLGFRGRIRSGQSNVKK